MADLHDPHHSPADLCCGVGCDPEGLSISSSLQTAVDVGTTSTSQSLVSIDSSHSVASHAPIFFSNALVATNLEPLSPMRYSEETLLVSGSRLGSQRPSRRAIVGERINEIARKLRVWPLSRHQQQTEDGLRHPSPGSGENDESAVMTELSPSMDPCSVTPWQSELGPASILPSKPSVLATPEKSLSHHAEGPLAGCHTSPQCSRAHKLRMQPSLASTFVPTTVPTLSENERRASRNDDELPPPPEYRTVDPNPSELHCTPKGKYKVVNGSEMDETVSTTSCGAHDSKRAETSTSTATSQESYARTSTTAPRAIFANATLMPTFTLLSSLSREDQHSPLSANDRQMSQDPGTVVAPQIASTKSDNPLPLAGPLPPQLRLDTSTLPLRVTRTGNTGPLTRALFTPQAVYQPELTVSSPLSNGVYQKTYSLVRNAVSHTLSNDLRRQLKALESYNKQLTCLDPTDILVQSHDYRLKLHKMAGLLETPIDLRSADQEDEATIARAVLSMSMSDLHRGAMLALNGDNARRLLDVIQDVLDAGLLAPYEESAKVRRLLTRLSKEYNQLPSYFFIQGVTDCDRLAHFGGGFGDVFKASYRGGVVALKRMRCFHSDEIERAKNQKKFFQEALLWKQLAHPHIVPFLGIDPTTFPPYLCLVSKWMRHGTVLKYLERRGRPTPVVNEMLLQVAQGLAHLHSLKIVHGDLRGANILINDQWEACLTDFGLTVYHDATVGTSNGHAGSVRWMAPELHNWAQFDLPRFRLTPETDMYSFACVCLELYTGSPPFPEIPADGGIILEVINGTRPVRPGLPCPISDEIWRMIEKCWSASRSARWTAGDVINILRGPSHLPEPFSSSSRCTPSRPWTSRIGLLSHHDNNASPTSTLVASPHVTISSPLASTPATSGSQFSSPVAASPASTLVSPSGSPKVIGLGTDYASQQSLGIAMWEIQHHKLNRQSDEAAAGSETGTEIIESAFDGDFSLEAFDLSAYTEGHVTDVDQQPDCMALEEDMEVRPQTFSLLAVPLCIVFYQYPFLLVPLSAIALYTYQYL